MVVYAPSVSGRAIRPVPHTRESYLRDMAVVYSVRRGVPVEFGLGDGGAEVSVVWVLVAWWAGVEAPSRPGPKLTRVGGSRCQAPTQSARRTAFLLQPHKELHSSLSRACWFSAMSDIPIRPPAPAPPLPSGWTEHKAPTGTCLLAAQPRQMQSLTSTRAHVLLQQGNKKVDILSANRRDSTSTNTTLPQSATSQATFIRCVAQPAHATPADFIRSSALLARAHLC